MSDANIIFNNVDNDYPDNLRDESRYPGKADTISFPDTEDKLRAQLVEVQSVNRIITLQGALTGITGGSVPNGGHVFNLSRMNRISGLRYDPVSNVFSLIVQPGVLLAEIQKVILEKEFDVTGWSPASLESLERFKGEGSYMFPPDPTESSASIGGMVACNASGARSFLYGSTRKYVDRLRIVLTDGSILDIKRGAHKAIGRSFSVKTNMNNVIDGFLPSYDMPNVKNAAGYFVKENMDLIDLFIGSEGTLGIFSEIEIKLIPLPDRLCGVMAFFPSEKKAISFVESIRYNDMGFDGADLAVIEFFDSNTLELLRSQKEVNDSFRTIGAMSAEWHTAIYIEYHGTNESVENAIEGMIGIIEECGGDDNSTWLADNEKELKHLKFFRHAVPEAVNLLIDEKRKTEPNITKLGTDLAVPDTKLHDIMDIYHTGLRKEGLKYVMFGHIGNNHIHVNIIPDNMDEYERGKTLYLKWASAVIKMGGTISGEHGVGKLKVDMLREMFHESGIQQMRKIKNLFDPYNILNRGNLFS